MRETLAALFLRAAGYAGAEPVLDPMCGSGTFVIEAAEVAPTSPRAAPVPSPSSGSPTFDPAAWSAFKAADAAAATPARFHGSDRDAGAVAMSRANAARAGVADVTDFRQAAVSDLRRPDGPAGLVIVNPPYGARLGDAAKLRPLYAALGRVLVERFDGWRVGPRHHRRGARRRHRPALRPARPAGAARATQDPPLADRPAAVSLTRSRAIHAAVTGP